MLTTLKFIYKLLPVWLLALLLFVGYVGYIQYQAKKQIQSQYNNVVADYQHYRQQNNLLKQMELNIIEEINRGQKETDNLRNSVDANLVELRVKVESIERDSSASSVVINQTLRLAEQSRQDYYHLINQIKHNDTMIKNWQQYYCLEIAPKNGTGFMCDN